MRIPWLLLALPMLASPADAQDQSRIESPAAIVVEGRRDRERQIREFVQALTPVPRGGQLGRFEWAAACPAAFGLVQPQNDAVAARIRRVAAAAGIQVADSGCRPNMLVIVTRDKAAFLAWLRRAHPAYFTDGAGRGIRVPAQPGPVTAWHVGGLLDADGVPVSADRVGYYVTEATRSPSRLSAATRPHFAASVMVVEADALAGLTIIQLADYAAMRAFARTDPVRLRDSAAPTILGIFDAPMDSPVPITLTQWDFAFLSALYASAENRYVTQQRHEIRRRVGEALESAEGQEED